MKAETRAKWQTKQGISLFQQMIKGEELTPENRAYLDEMKRADPPNPKLIAEAEAMILVKKVDIHPL